MDFSELTELHQKYEQLDRAAVIKEDDSASFSNVKQQIERIFEWEADFYKASGYRQQLPEADLKNIGASFTDAFTQFQDIIHQRTNNLANLIQQKDGISNTIRSYYQTLYNSFVKDYRGWKLEHEGEGYEAQLRALVSEAKASQKKIKSTEKDIQSKAEAANVATQEIGLSELAGYFYQLVKGDNDWIDSSTGFKRWSCQLAVKPLRGYAGGARIWLLLAVIMFAITFVIAYLQLDPFVKELATPNAYAGKASSYVYAVLIAKALILIAPIYTIRFCLKNYGSNKHLAADALHKAKTLQTLSAYLAVVKNDPQAIREIASSVAKLVFGPTDSGFIVSKGDFGTPDININTPFKS